LPIATEKQRLAAAIQRDEARRIAIEYRQAAGEGMSAIPPKADIAERDRNVRFVPKADSCSAAKHPAIRSPRGA
jgi:hypothetical protein